MKLLKICALTLALTGMSAHAHGVVIDEDDFGPSYGSTIADITVAKPLNVAGVGVGALVHVLGLPFTLLSGDVNESYDTLVRKPYENLKRCTGCSAEYDAYKASLTNPDESVSFLVLEPSEITINNHSATVVAP